MNGIGGYPELELSKGEEYHQRALCLNTGRNALELILRIRKYSKVYLPFYTCDVMFEPFCKLNIEYASYSIDKNFEPIFDYSQLRDNEGFLYINYFGIKSAFIPYLAMHCKNMVIDNSHAFFLHPVENIDTFYSCRKFFGVPDGAYLYITGRDQFDLPQDVSLDRVSHLVKRIEYGPDCGYEDFRRNEEKLINQPIMRMSKLTRSILKNIHYENVKTIRQNNFAFIHESLAKYNELNFSVNEDDVPMVYPFLYPLPGLRQMLIKNKIYVAQYWPLVSNWTSDKNAPEIAYSDRLCPLPVNQNLDREDMVFLVNTVLNIIGAGKK